MSRTPTNGFDPSWANDHFSSTSQSSRMASAQPDTQATTSPDGFSPNTPIRFFGEYEALVGDVVYPLIQTSRGSVPPPNTPVEEKYNLSPMLTTSSLSVLDSSLASCNAGDSQCDTPTSTVECPNGGSSSLSTPPEPELKAKDTLESDWAGQSPDPDEFSLISVPSESDLKKPSWTGEYSNRGFEPEVKNKGKQPAWTEEYSTYGAEPEPSPAELERSFSWFEDDEEEYFHSLGSTSEQAGLDKQPTLGQPFRTLMAMLPIRSVKSGTVSITDGTAMPQAAMLCSPSQAEPVKEEKPNIIGRVLRRAGAIRLKRRKQDPEPPKREPNHANLSPERSCLKPTTPMDGTVDRIDDVNIYSAPVERRTGSPKSVSFDEVPTISECPRTKYKPQKADGEQKCHPEALDEDTESEDDSPSEFAAQDEEVERLLQRASDICMNNERAAILRGSLDFYLVVCDRIDTVASDRINEILQRLGPRSIGSYVGEEKDFTKGCFCGNKVPPHMYRTKETAMSWTRRRQARNVIRLGAAWARDLW